MFRFRQLILAHLRQHLLLYVLAVGFFLLGVIMGSLGVQVMDAEQANELGSFVANFLEYQKAHTLPDAQTIGTLLWNNLRLLLIFILAGLSVVGIIITPFILFIRGFLIGFVTGFFTFDQGGKGIALSLATMFPHSLINIPVLLIAAVISLKFSLSLIRANQRGENFLPRFGRYVLVNILLALVVTGSAGLEGYLSPMFMKVVATYLN